jgi:hypothetical protein
VINSLVSVVKFKLPGALPKTSYNVASTCTSGVVRVDRVDGLYLSVLCAVPVCVQFSASFGHNRRGRKNLSILGDSECCSFGK